MHAFPPASDLQFLIGREIQQICLDPWSVQFRFHPVGQISVESLFEHVTASGETHRHEVADREARPLHLYEIMQQPIVDIAVQDDWLTLLLGNGAKLRIFAEVGGQYESGQIHEGADMRFCTVF